MTTAKFLDLVRISDRSIELDELTVEASPYGNWAIYHNGSYLMTINKKVLTSKLVETINNK